MAKRFTDNKKFKYDWYRKLTPKQKCLWEFLLCECSKSGIIEIDFESLTFHIGGNITAEDFKPLNDKIVYLRKDKIYIPLFLELQKSRSGKYHHNWQGGITSESRKDRNCPKYKKWVKDVLKKYNFTCANCGIYGIGLECHHILSFSKHKDKRFDVSNGICYCKECHRKIHKGSKI